LLTESVCAVAAEDENSMKTISICKKPLFHRVRFIHKITTPALAGMVIIVKVEAYCFVAFTDVSLFTSADTEAPGFTCFVFFNG